MRQSNERSSKLIIRTLMLLAALTSLPAAAAAADIEPGSSTVVDLNSWDPGNGTTLFLGPGDYTFVAVAGNHTAWRAWGYVSGCNDEGECQTGWVTQFRIVPALLDAFWAGSVVWANPELALANTVAYDLCLEDAQDVTTRILDSHYGDNTGGVSVEITRHNGLCAEFDGDGDGVHNKIDACPDSDEGALVDESGCSIADYCPCDDEWKNHEHYVSCVVPKALVFFLDGLLDGVDLGSVVSEAAESECGEG